jgi:hypothetical protein
MGWGGGVRGTCLRGQKSVFKTLKKNNFFFLHQVKCLIAAPNKVTSFQNKFLRMIEDAPWSMPNMVI